MSELQKRLFAEINDDNLFDLSNKYGKEYIHKAFDRNVYPLDEALANLKIFNEKLNDDYITSKDIIEQLNKYGAPATVSQIAGRYFGFVNGGVVPAGLAARILSDFWDQNTAMQIISPIASQLEIVVERWLKELFSLPSETSAGFVSGTSMATFCGLAAARYRVLKRKGWDVNEKGLFNAPPVRIITGKHAHSTVIKAIGLLGFGNENIEWVDTDSQGRIIPEKIPALDDNTILILQAGNVNSGSYDPFDQIMDKANKANAWVHIDGAFGLWAAVVAKFNHLTRDIQKADSWSVDGHKTLNAPYDSGIILCKDKEALISALHMSGSYIIQGKDRDGMFYTPEMSRRARIIEIWATIKSLGRKGISEMVFGFHERAVQFSNELKEAGFEILNDVCFNQILVHYKNNDATKQVLKKVQDDRVCWCGGSKWDGKDVIRISVCSWATSVEDIKLSVNSFIKAKGEIN